MIVGYIVHFDLLSLLFVLKDINCSWSFLCFFHLDELALPVKEDPLIISQSAVTSTWIRFKIQAC